MNVNAERDFSDIMLIFWHERVLIAAILLTSCVICVGYLLFFPQEGSVNWDISPLKIAEFDKYQELNTLSPAVANPLIVAAEQTVPFFYVGDKQIVNMLIEDLTQAGTLKTEITEWLLNANKADMVSSSIDDEMTKELSNFTITPPTDDIDRANPRVKVFNANWSISYRGKLGFSAKTILDQALSKSTEHVRQVLLQKFETKVNITRRDQLFKKQALEKAIQNITSDYETKTNSRLALLAEQEKIAHALGISKSTIEVQSFGTTNAVIGNVRKADDAASSYYLRGFEAINEEMNLLRNRNDINLFIPELLNLQVKLRAIEQDVMVSSVTTAFDKTPITTGNFSAATYDIFTAKLKPTIGKSIYLALSLLLGMLASIAIVYMKILLKTNNSSTMTASP